MTLKQERNKKEKKNIYIIDDIHGMIWKVIKINNKYYWVFDIYMYKNIYYSIIL